MKTDRLKKIVCALPFVTDVYEHEGSKVYDKNAVIFVHTLKQGGSQRAVELLIERLNGQDFGVFVLSPVTGEYADIYSKEYDACVIITDPDIVLPGDARKDLYRFDIAIFNSFCSFEYSLYYINTGIPCVYWLHEGEEVTKQNVDNIDRIIIGGSNCLYAFPWPKPLKMWEDAYPYAKTLLLPIEVEDLYKGCRKDEPKDRIRFLIPGNYNPHKGFHIVVQALLIMEARGYKDYEAVFCGYDAQGEYYDIIANACSNVERITLLGELGKEELYKQISEADCVIVPSVFDAGPLTAVEALMMSKALIVSDACGMSALIKDCYNGLVFGKEDYNELLNKMMFVYQYRNSLTELGGRGRIVYEENYTKEIMDRAFDELLETV